MAKSKVLIDARELTVMSNIFTITTNPLHQESKELELKGLNYYAVEKGTIMSISAHKLESDKVITIKTKEHVGDLDIPVSNQKFKNEDSIFLNEREALEFAAKKNREVLKLAESYKETVDKAVASLSDHVDKDTELLAEIAKEAVETE
jgi:hypothetical protein